MSKKFSYNTAAKYAFSKNCVTMDRDPTETYYTTVTVMNTIVQSIELLLNVRTVYKYFLDNKCTEQFSEISATIKDYRKRLQRNIADLFDVRHSVNFYPYIFNSTPLNDAWQLKVTTSFSSTDRTHKFSIGFEWIIKN